MPWSALFDRISADYGWSDDQIFELPLRRLWSIKQVMYARIEETQKMWTVLAETITRTVSSFVAAGPSKVNIKNAESISFQPRQAEETGPTPGSFEKLQGMFA